MEQAFSELCDLLTDEVERQEAVVALLKSQGEAVLARDAETVRDRTREIELLVQETATAEGPRLEVVRRLVDYHELAVESQTMTHLVALAPGPWRERLEALQKRLQAALRTAHDEVRANARLIRHSQRIVNGCLAWFEPMPAQGYSGSGKTPSRTTSPALIDQKG